MKLISWNVNGLRACMGKGFLDFVAAEQPDMLCLQETKMQPGQADVPLEGGYREYWNSAEKKGYSGVALFTKTEPQSVTYGLGIEEHDHEGRVITADYGEFYLVTVYTPNSQNELKRLDYRMTWEDAFREYLVKLDAEKPVIVCGDFNDTPLSYTYRLMSRGLQDAFREKGRGFSHTYRGFYNTFRIDYVLVSDDFEVLSYEVPSVEFSDHHPVFVRLKYNSQRQ